MTRKHKKMPKKFSHRENKTHENYILVQFAKIYAAKISRSTVYAYMCACMCEVEVSLMNKR